MTDSGESKLPLQYEDGPDFCTVRDAQGRDFALTMQPELMKAMEKALSNETASFKRPPVQCSSAGNAEAVLRTAASAFEFIRLKLVDCLDEPQRSAFWKAVEVRDVLRDVIAELPTSPEVASEPQTLGQWQPIDTAPREPDAMFMVCAVGDARGPFVVRSDILWRAREAGTPSHLGLDYLTHWMPLPEMPK